MLQPNPPNSGIYGTLAQSHKDLDLFASPKTNKTSQQELIQDFKARPKLTKDAKQSIL